jgi:hypothetical protein
VRRRKRMERVYFMGCEFCPKLVRIRQNELTIKKNGYILLLLFFVFILWGGGVLKNHYNILPITDKLLRL